MSSDRRKTRPSAARSANARVQAVRINRRRGIMPKCGARAKSTGEPCGNLAMENGRCYLHGGATPKGDGKWQRPVWPKMDTPAGIAKFYRKDAELKQRAKKRERRVARMSPTDRAGYDRWKATHAPTSKAKRAAARERERQAREALAVMQVPARSDELQALYDELAAAEAHLRALDRQDDLSEAWVNGTGVFG